MPELRPLLLLLCCCLLPALEPQVEMWVDQAQVAVGDRVTVHVRYRWPLTWHIEEEPRPGMAFDRAGVFLEELSAPEILDDGQYTVHSWKLTVLATRSGAWLLPQPGMQISDPAGVVHTAAAPQVIIQVGTDAAAPEPAPPAALWQAADNPPEAGGWWWVIVPALLLLLTLWLWRRSRRQQMTVLSPDERFHRDLQLVAATLDGKHAGSLLSQALRRYVGDSYGFDGLGATTRELRGLIDPHLVSDERVRLLNLLEQLDSQRWAPQDLDPSSVSPRVEEARVWVATHRQRLAREAAAVAAKDVSDAGRKNGS